MADPFEREDLVDIYRHHMEPKGGAGVVEELAFERAALWVEEEIKKLELEYSDELLLLMSLAFMAGEECGEERAR